MTWRMEVDRMLPMLRSIHDVVTAVLRWPADADDGVSVLLPTPGDAVTADIRARGLSGALDVGRARGADVQLWR